MVRISGEVIRQMTDHALAELPNECCGFLSGRGNFIDGRRRCRNARSSPSEFSVPPGEIFDFFRSLREEGREFLGIYHSHPGGESTPSKRDEEEFHYPEVTYWIVSLNNGVAGVRCFEWGRMNFTEVPFEVVEPSQLTLPVSRGKNWLDSACVRKKN